MAAPALPLRIVFCLILAAGIPVFAGQKTVVIPLIPVSGWNLVSSQKVPLKNLGQFGNQGPVDHEYGAQSAIERTYLLGSVKATAVLEEAADPSAAYGLYTFYQNESMRKAHGVQLAMIGTREALMTRGRYFIRIVASSGSVPSVHEFESLLILIGGTRLSAGNVESLPPPLPREGLIAGSEKYILGIEAAKRVLGALPADLIGFQDGVEVETGTYRVGASRLSLVQISYPTPQLAQLRFKSMQPALRINQGQGPGAVYGRQEGSYAFLVLNAPNQASAVRVLSRFGVAESVSWNARYHSQSQFTYQVLQLVIANLELVLIIAGFALFGGAFIFLGKLVIMKAFPNSPWPRPDEDEIIRLKLSVPNRLKISKL